MNANDRFPTVDRHREMSKSTPDTLSSKDTPPGLWAKLTGATLRAYIHSIYKSGPMVIDPPHALDEMEDHGPVIIAFWHGQFALLPLARPPGPVHAMVAHHGDAEFIGEILRRFDMKLIRGAGAGERKKDRGGAGALRAALKALKDGNHLAMTADIPPDLTREVGDGILTIARMSGRPIYPCAIATSRFRTLNTSSRFTINFPFSKISAAGGPPIYVQRDATAEDLEVKRKEVEDALNLVTRKAYKGAGRSSQIEIDRERERRRRPLLLKTYRGLTRTLVHANANRMLDRRTARGKEDPARRNERLGQPKKNRPSGPLIWFHAASVGELLTTIPVLHAVNDKLADRAPNILVTTVTRTSAQLAAERLPDNAIHQFVPLDTPQAIGSFLDHWAPSLAVLVESEIWPNTIIECGARHIPLMFINARMSARSSKRWRWLPSISRPLMAHADLVLAQTPKMARRFKILGAANVQSAGNLKVDIKPTQPGEKDVASLRQALGTEHVFLAASTHAGEESIVMDAHKLMLSHVPDLKTIIAPRHPDRAGEIAELAASKGLTIAWRSRGTPPNADLYLADTIGELPLLYRSASVALIGGTLVEHGGQNPMEAIRCGTPVLAGPDRSNFEDIFKQLQRRGGVVDVTSSFDIATSATNFLQNPDAGSEQTRRAEQALDEISGALQKTVSEICKLYLETESETH